MNKSVEFPLAGDGCRIEFPVSALIILEQKYGVGDAFEVIETRLMAAAATTVADCLEFSLRRTNETGKLVPVKMSVDEWEFTPQDAVIPIMDGLSLAWFGHDYVTTLTNRHEQNMAAELEALKSAKVVGDEAADPLAGSEASSGSQ